MSKQPLSTPSAPPALGPYSVAVEAGGLVFVSGQVAIASDGTRVDGTAGEQARVIMANIGAILGDVGLGLDDIAKSTIFLTDIADFVDVNAVYAEGFSVAPPARSTVQVAALPGGFSVEIEVVAAR